MSEDMRVGDEDLTISVDGASGDLYSLHAWLRRHDGLRARLVPVPPGDNELGASDVLMVACGSGGVGIALAAALRTWLESRKPTVKIHIKTTDTEILVDITNADDVLPVLREALRDR